MWCKDSAMSLKFKTARVDLGTLFIAMVLVTSCHSFENGEEGDATNIIWKSEHLIIFNVSELDSNFTKEMPVNGTSNETDVCVDLNVIPCLSRDCEWARGECRKFDSSRPYPRPYPTSASEFFELLKVMWEYPPQDFPKMWSAFFVFGIVLVVTMTLGVTVKCAFCCSKCWRRRNSGERGGCKGKKKLVLVLPRGRRVPVDDYIIDNTGDVKRLIVMPKRRTTAKTKQQIEQLKIMDTPESPQPGPSSRVMKDSSPYAMLHAGDVDLREFKGGEGVVFLKTASEIEEGMDESTL